MAKNKKNSLKADKTNNNESSKSKGILFTLIAFFTAIFIVAVIFGGAFYIVMHNNINGMADRYRKNIQNIPVLKLAGTWISKEQQ
jgi:flagellar basal body-associated protein FliL